MREADNLDAAQELQDLQTQQALERVRANLAAEILDPDFDGLHCVDGGEEIPQARRALGKTRCVACQEIRERGSKLWR